MNADCRNKAQEAQKEAFLLRVLCIFAAILFLIRFCPNVRADDAITSVMSPIVSYQYPEDLGTEVLANGGVQSPLVSFQYLEDYSSAALTSGGIMSPIASYQYYEWPGNDILNLQSSPVVSYYYQFSGSLGAAFLHGRVTDTKGVPLAGATVTAMIFLLPVAQATTDANGNYELPSVEAGNYLLSALDSTHQISMRVLTFNASTAEQDFQLMLLPPQPATQQVARSSTVDYTVGDVMGSLLRIFDGSGFVPITANNWPSPSLETIVMTHGWVLGSPDSAINTKPFDGWPPEMAAKLRGQGVNAANANILAWDWRYAATAGILTVGVPADRTPDQGVALGEALQYYLGATYSQPLHFLGNSLGALVNASAINYLHSEKIGIGYHCLTPWIQNLVQVTVFDQAESAVAVEDLIESKSPIVQSPLPVAFTWAENYKSLVGFGNFPNAVNVNLQKGVLTTVANDPLTNPLQIAADSHRYAVEWYESSITFLSDQYNPLGFKRSYEYAPGSFPPTDIQNGSLYHQTALNYDELALEPVTGVMSYLPAWGDTVLQAAADTVQYTTGVTVQSGDTSEISVPSYFNYVDRVAASGGQAVVNFGYSMGLNLRLSTTSPSSFVGHVHANDSSSTLPMAWLPIQFPSDAAAMSFDMTVEGDPEDDVLVCGIGTSNLFTLAAKYIPTNQFSASRLIDVSAWAGTTNELFFGFLGGTSTNATLQVDNIRFYSLQAPSLAVQQAVGGVALSWPSSAAGYVLESTTSLSSPDWEPVTDVPVIAADCYMLTKSCPANATFFRLRSQ